MAVNAVPVSAARQPRGIVTVSGVRLDAWVNFEVENNTFYEADSFRVMFALSALPFAYNDAWWASQPEIFIEILAGFPANPDNYAVADLQSLTYGRVDNIDYDPVARTLTVTGRDMTAAMIDAKTTETFQNMTSSKIATMIAQRHGLTPVVTSTPKLSGRYYAIDSVRVNQQRSEWDLLTALADEEEFVVYVKRKELHFELAPTATAAPYLLKWEPPSDQNGAFAFNGKSISFSRALTLARGVVVTVQSVSPKTGKSVKVTFPQKQAGVKPGQSAAVAQQYSYTFAHMTYEKALQKAQQLHADISQHEVKMSVTMPADNLLLVTSIISMIGTGTAFDQTYYPESITREMDINQGYTMAIKAKNHSPLSVVSL